VPAALILFVAESFAQTPFASIDWIEGAFGIVIAVMLVLALTLFLTANRPTLKRLGGVLSALILFGLFTQSSTLAFQSGDFYKRNYSIVNCDVGQGDALVIRSKEQVAVVDVGGENPSIDECLNGLGIDKIDLLVLTHDHLDHVGGLLGAITGRKVEVAMVSSFREEGSNQNPVHEVLSNRGIPLVEAEKGMSGELGEFTWEVLGPSRGAPEAEDKNDASTTMFWSNPRIALFTMADSGERAQFRIGTEYKSLLESDHGSKVIVVKVAHHGSSDQAPEFYEAVSADIALISAGQDNSYGHPTKRTLDLLAYTGTKVFRTDEMGSIGITETAAGVELSVSGRS
jgi:competence protein ComEC